MNGLTDELSNSYAGCYINDKCFNHIMDAVDIASWHLLARQCRICLMSATIMELQMIFIYKAKCYTLSCPSVLIGFEPLRFVNETK